MKKLYHPNEKAHKKVMEWAKNASPEEIFETAVEVGIYTKDGKLTKEYGGEEMKDYNIWTCKIGVKGDIELPNGDDLPMRRTIQKAFFELTGKNAEFCFSGWGGDLTEIEKIFLENKSELK